MAANSISISISVTDVARADILIITNRIYYRFATTDTAEEGELPYNNTTPIIEQLELSLLSPTTNPLPDDVKFHAVIKYQSTNDDIIIKNNMISTATFNSIIKQLSNICDEFIFFKGFY